jgi:hypothetical protein
MRTCCMCHQERPEADFAFRSIKTGVRQDHCRVCHAAYRRQHYLNNREAYVAREVARMKRYREENRPLLLEYLKLHPCVDCGQSDPILLEFDHRDRTTKTKPVTHIALRKPWKRVLAEIAKCDVRCVVCHRRRTAQQMNWRLPSDLMRAPETTVLPRLLLTGERTCTRCGQTKPAIQFSIKNKKTGRQSTRCVTCVAAASREHYRRNTEAYLGRARSRKRWLNPKRNYRLEYLLTHPCVDCGESDPLLLEFDHRAGELKLNDVSRLIWERKWVDVENEIAKCDVRCVACHRRKTARDFGWSRLGEELGTYVFAAVA